MGLRPHGHPTTAQVELASGAGWRKRELANIGA
jgi:hypothetical protein